jgi:hypothetical protein
MTHRSTLILSVLVTLCIVAVASAYGAGIHSNAFGRGGSTPKLNTDCSRKPMFLTPAGKSWDGAAPNGKQFTSQALSVVKGQLDCSVLRTNRIMRCLSKPVPVTAEAPADKEGFHDTQGLDALRAYIVAENACVAAVTGVKR